MDGEVDDPVERVASQVRTYMDAHPEASDGIEGIQRWWLPRAAQDLPPQCIREAMDRLTADGIVESHRLPDGGIVYRRRRSTSGQGPSPPS